MSNWFDSEMDVLRRQDLAHETSRRTPLQLPEEHSARPSLFSRLFGWLDRKPRQEPGEAPKPALRAGH
jgi:hypothetical protein